ncbi:hypothetical protein D9M69_307400 [compost metagenome]
MVGVRVRRLGPGLRERHAEALGVDAVRIHASVAQCRLGLVDHRRRPADEGRIDVVHRDQGLEEGGDAAVVKPAVQQVYLLRLARQHVVQREARQVLVLQVFQRLGKDDAVDIAVAVDQREAAARLGLQRGADQRQHRRDAAARRKGDIVARCRRIQRHVEAAVRRHHVDHLAGRDGVVEMGRKQPVLDQLHRHAQFALCVIVLHRRADRIRAPQVLAVDRCLQRQELALGEAVGIAQRMELWGHGSLASARRGSVGFEIVERLAAIQAAVQRLARR